MSSNIQTINRAFLAYSTVMLLARVFIVSSAFADDQAQTETVGFQDLNVATPAGAEALYRRIHAAAERVCSPPAGWGEQIRAHACARTVVAQAVEKLNLPALTAYHQKKTGGQTERITANR